MKLEALAFAGMMAVLLVGAAGVQTYRLSVAEDRLGLTDAALTTERARTAGLRNAIREVEYEAARSSSQQAVAQEGKQAVSAAAAGKAPPISAPMWEAFKAVDRIGGFQ